MLGADTLEPVCLSSGVEQITCYHGIENHCLELDSVPLEHCPLKLEVVPGLGGRFGAQDRLESLECFGRSELDAAFGGVTDGNVPGKVIIPAERY